MNTPWGKADSVDTICPGIKWVTTPGHGGMHVDEKLNQAIKIHQNTSGWYEEDCEWAIAFMYLIGYISKHNPVWFSQHKDSAAHTLMNWYPYIYQDITGNLPKLEESLKLREEKFLDLHQEHFVVFSAVSSDQKGWVECWAVMLRDNHSEARSSKEFQVLIPEEKYDKRDFDGYVLDGDDIKRNHAIIIEKYTDSEIKKAMKQ